MSEKYSVRRGLYVLYKGRRLVMQAVISYKAGSPLRACLCFWQVSGGSRKDLLLLKAAWFVTAPVCSPRRARGGKRWALEQLTSWLGRATSAPGCCPAAGASSADACPVAGFWRSRLRSTRTCWEPPGQRTGGKMASARTGQEPAD